MYLKINCSGIFFACFLWSVTFNLSAQSASSTYSAGDIPTNFSSYSGACNGPLTALVVNVPAGANVTSIDISYDMVAFNNAYMSEQRSQIHCQETATTEGLISGAGGATPGTESYNRTGVTIANGITATGVLTFEMRAWRTWGGTLCDAAYQFIDNNTWTITVHYNIPGPMMYSSATTTQSNTAAIDNCDGSAEMVGLEVVTTGSSSPLDLTSIDVATTGTTNLAEVSAINVYYTGTTNTFATTTLFGTAAPGASVTINGTQTLASGTNYFWVEYVLVPIMTNGNTFDASCSKIVVDGTNYVPTVTSPAGNRVVGACNPAPGGVSTGFQTWFDANSGTTGAPVTSWANIGPNVSVPQIDSPNGAPLLSEMKRANFNNIIDLQGAYDGTFHYEVSDRTDVISGNEVAMFCAYQGTGAPDLIFNYHGSIQGGGPGSGNQWHAWGFRHGGIGSLYGAGSGLPYNAGMIGGMSSNAGFVGMSGTNGGAGVNCANGVIETMANTGGWYSGGGTFELSVGYWPGFGTGRDVMEAIMWDHSFSTLERNKVETYLAIKYGIVLGTNGTSMDYTSPWDGSVIWDISANPGFNYDIAGVMRADVSGLDQRKSHSTNGTAVDSYNDIVTMANGTNFASPAQISNDGAALVWGHDNGALINTGVMVNYPTDNGEVIEAIFTREWKSQESGTTGTLTVEFDLSNVVGVNGVLGANDLADVRMLVDEDGDYSVGATSIAPSSYNNGTGIVYFQHDFIATSGNPMDQSRGYFFTLGTTDVTSAPLPVVLASYLVENSNCDNLIEWVTNSEEKCNYFEILRSYDLEEWTSIAKIDGAYNSTTAINYQFIDRDFDRNGPVYYQLLQYDTDGNVNLLGTEGVQSACSENMKPVLYPNPTDGAAYVFAPDAASYTIMDAQGRIIQQGELVAGENLWNLSVFASGTYMVHFTMKSGKQFIEQLIVL